MSRSLTTIRGLCLLGALFSVGGCGKSTARWAEEMKSGDVQARLSAVRALQTRRGEGKTVVPLLIAALKDEDVYVRRDAARGLGLFGAEAREAIPGLQAALKDPEGSVRRAAGQALKKIDPDADGTAGAPGPR